MAPSTPKGIFPDDNAYNTILHGPMVNGYRCPDRCTPMDKQDINFDIANIKRAVTKPLGTLQPKPWDYAPLTHENLSVKKGREQFDEAAKAWKNAVSKASRNGDLCSGEACLPVPEIQVYPEHRRAVDQQMIALLDCTMYSDLVDYSQDRPATTEVRQSLGREVSGGKTRLPEFEEVMALMTCIRSIQAKSLLSDSDRDHLEQLPYPLNREDVLREFVEPVFEQHLLMNGKELEAFNAASEIEQASISMAKFEKAARYVIGAISTADNEWEQHLAQVDSKRIQAERERLQGQKGRNKGRIDDFVPARDFRHAQDAQWLLIEAIRPRIEANREHPGALLHEEVVWRRSQAMIQVGFLADVPLIASDMMMPLLAPPASSPSIGDASGPELERPSGVALGKRRLEDGADQEDKPVKMARRSPARQTASPPNLWDSPPTETELLDQTYHSQYQQALALSTAQIQSPPDSFSDSSLDDPFDFGFETEPHLSMSTDLLNRVFSSLQPGENKAHLVQVLHAEVEKDMAQHGDPEDDYDHAMYEEHMVRVQVYLSMLGHIRQFL